MGRKAYPNSINTGNVNNFNVTNIHNNIVNGNKGIADENSEIMEWLSPREPRRRHQDVRTDKVDGVGNWLLGTNESRDRGSGDGGMGGAGKTASFCHGNPGAGKTYLSSLVIDTSATNGPSEEEIAVVGFYCDFRDQQQQATTNIFGAILKKLVVRDEMLENVKQHIKRRKRSLAVEVCGFWTWCE